MLGFNHNYKKIEWLSTLAIATEKKGGMKLILNLYLGDGFPPEGTLITFINKNSISLLQIISLSVVNITEKLQCSQLDLGLFLA